MEYICPVSELEQQLRETGEQLALHPSSTSELLDILDKTEQLLTFVSQAPSLKMQGALVPSMGALISNELLKHSDVDVKVSVASCLCEVARITAPEPPYKDEIMKDIFQLNVMAFGELSNVTGRNYYKAIHILQSVAKVKSCLLMLDLECDALILEMFEQFLSRIRTNHPQSVFSDMESIMTMVLEESDEIASQLLSLLISHVRKENQNVSPAPWKLAEKVLRNCHDTLKPYSSTLVELIEADSDDYAEIVSTLCQNELMEKKPTKSNNFHKRDANTLMHSHSKKQKHIDTQKVSKKIEDYHKNQIKGKDLEASQNLNSPHETHSSKGRPKNKKVNSSQDSKPKLVQDSKEDLRKTRFQDKASNSAKLKEKSQGMKKSLTSNSSVIKKEDDIIYKGLGNGKQLVGHRIKVWWPLDKMYYEGAVSSYNPVDKKHKVLYADGDEEVLDLRVEKWIILDKSSPHKEKSSDLPTPMTTSSTKRLKQKGKRKLEFSPMEEDNMNSPKSSSLKTKPTKEDDITNSSTNEVVEINDASSTEKMDPIPTTEVEEETKIKTERLEEL
ncbi:sister chromatid cohesion protein PDS5 homolog D [Lactuca sativa]|uniref:Tudor domain-containing protein n=1 Tax=Lactuca sativa TaxID=4236 RepID=A0A9R1VVB0_LACSA|nr:sister chromatid cohesion protein PDS5 homolog D [Lactuca sativa]KAJ0211208.1 hypothetical protein LSAT_V11C400191310 [Lactuca sativa]